MEQRKRWPKWVATLAISPHYGRASLPKWTNEAFMHELVSCLNVRLHRALDKQNGADSSETGEISPLLCPTWNMSLTERGLTRGCRSPREASQGGDSAAPFR